MADNILQNTTPNFIKGRLRSPDQTGLANVSFKLIDALTQKEIYGKDGQPVKITTSPTGEFQYEEALNNGYYILQPDDPLDRFYIAPYVVKLEGAIVPFVDIQSYNDEAPDTDTQEASQALGAAAQYIGLAGGALYYQHEFKNERLRQYMHTTLDEKFKRGIDDEIDRIVKNHNQQLHQTDLEQLKTQNLAYYIKKYGLTQSGQFELKNEMKRVSDQRAAAERLLQAEKEAGKITEDEYQKRLSAVRNTTIDRSRLPERTHTKMLDIDSRDQARLITNRFGLDDNNHNELSSQIKQTTIERQNIKNELRQKLSDGSISTDDYSRELILLNNTPLLETGKLSTPLQEKIRAAHVKSQVDHLSERFSFDDKEKQVLTSHLNQAYTERAGLESTLRSKLENGTITKEEYRAQAKALQDASYIDPKRLNPTMRDKLNAKLKQQPKAFQKEIKIRTEKALIEEKTKPLIDDLKKEQRKFEEEQRRREKSIQEGVKERVQRATDNIGPEEIKEAAQQFRTGFQDLKSLTRTTQRALRRPSISPQGVVRFGKNIVNIAQKAKNIASTVRTAATVARTAAVAVSNWPVLLIILIIILLIIAFYIITTLVGSKRPAEYVEVPGLELRLETSKSQASVNEKVYFTLGIIYDFARTQIPVDTIEIQVYVPQGTVFSEATGIYTGTELIVWRLANQPDLRTITFALTPIADNTVFSVTAQAISTQIGAPGRDTILPVNSSLESLFVASAQNAGIPLAFLKAIAKTETGVLSYTQEEVNEFSTPNWWSAYPNPDPLESTDWRAIKLIDPKIRRGYAYDTCGFPIGLCGPGADVRGVMQFEIRTWDGIKAGIPFPEKDRRIVRDNIYGAGLHIKAVATTYNVQFGFLDNINNWSESQVRMLATIYCTGNPDGDPKGRGCGREGVGYDDLVWAAYKEFSSQPSL